jgi:hypothetical protein
MYNLRPTCHVYVITKDRPNKVYRVRLPCFTPQLLTRLISPFQPSRAIHNFPKTPTLSPSHAQMEKIEKKIAGHYNVSHPVLPYLRHKLMLTRQAEHGGQQPAQQPAAPAQPAPPPQEEVSLALSC